MSNPSKQKGTAFETLIADYLRTYFPTVERRALNGATDRGDIAGVPRLVIECKNHKTMNLAGWLDEAERERLNAREPVGVVIHKRRGKSDPRAQYVTMDLETFVGLYQAALGTTQ